MSIYKKRKNYKPFEYPRVKEFTDAMSSSYWVESEVDFGASIQDYHTMDEVKREIFIRAILTIAQVEVEVKAFWGDLYRHFPKPEFNNLGATFAESECYDSETEVLTAEGFKYFKDINYETKVAAYALETGVIKFEEPSHILVKDYEGFMHHYRSKMTDLKVTPKHNIIVINPHSKAMKLAPSNSGKWGGNFLYPMSGEGVGTNKEFTALDRLLIAIQADGTLFGTTPSGKVDQRLDFSFILGKERKIERLKSLLDELSITYKESLRSNGQTSINASLSGLVTYEDILKVKDFGYINIEDVSKEWGEQFIEELAHWDSHLRDGVISYYNTSEESIDKVSAIALLSGYSTNKNINRTAEKALKTQNPDGTVRKSSKDCFVVSMYKKDTTVYPYRKEVEYKGKVYCCTVSTGAIVTRRGGRITISGNCRHSEAYSKTLEVLGIEDRFLELLEIPAFKRKLKMIENIMGNPEVTIESKLLFFTLVIENSSLFSYFAIGTSFARFEGKMKNLTNMINWSAIDESLHGEAGIWLINEIRKEKDIFEGLDMKAMVEEYVEVESEMLDWIFEQGQLKYFTKEDLLNYIKYRLDMSFVKIGLNKTYNITNEQLAPMNWFEEQVFGERSDDFFAIRPVDYTKHDKSFTGDDLF